MGAQRIKGITIEIDGDATGLDKALKDVNSSINTTQKALKDVNKLLQLDPGNVELIAQKQRLLGETTDQVKSKLDTLREAAKQANEALASGSMNQNQYDALQREIIDTTNELKKLEEEQKQIGSDSSGLVSFGSKCEELGLKIQKVSAAAALAVGAITAMAVEAGKAADDLNTMAKQTGLSTEALQKMAYASDLIDVDMNTITSSISKMKRSLDSQAATFEKIGVQIKNQKGEYRDIEGIFNDTVKALGNVKNETERDTIAMTLFGRSADQLAGIIDDGGESLRRLGDEAQKMGRIIPQEELDKANEFNDTLDKLKATLKADFAKAGASMAAALAPAFETIATWVEKAADALAKIPAPVLAAITVILAIVAAASTFLIVLGKLATGISALVNVLPLLSGVLTSTVIPALLKFNAAILSFAANPVVLAVAGIIAALALLGFAIYEIVQHWDEISAAATEAAQATKDAWSDSAIGQQTSRQFNAAKDAVVDACSTMKNTWSSTGHDIVGLAQSIFESVKSGVATYMAETAGLTKDQLEVIVGYFGGKAKSILDSVVSTFTQIKNEMVSKMRDAVEGVIDYIKSLPDRAREALNGLADKVAEPFENLINKAKNWGKDLVDNFADGILKNNKAVDATTKMAQDVQDRIGFSEPDKGPLSNFHTYAPDMIDLWVKGIRQNMYKVSAATNQMAATMNPAKDTSAAMNNSTVALAGVGGGTMNVYVDHISELSDLIRIQKQAQQMNRMGARI